MNQDGEEVKKYLAEAELIVKSQALPGSLTAKILDGWYGEQSRKYLFVKKAMELAREAKQLSP